MVLRPEERANESEIERDMALRSGIKSAAKTAATFGVGAAAGSSSLTSKVLPLLSQYIPTDLALKGISKVAPKVGDFIRRGMKEGLDPREGMEFIKEKISPKEDRNIIEQYSPELHQFIIGEIKSGRSPLEAGAMAELPRKGKNFEKVIKQMVNDHKIPWSAILETAYGGQSNQQQQGGNLGPQQSNQMPQGAQQNPASQGGAGQQALMDILNKINQRMGK